MPTRKRRNAESDVFLRLQRDVRRGHLMAWKACRLDERKPKSIPELPVAPWGVDLSFESLPETHQAAALNASKKKGWVEKFVRLNHYNFQLHGNFTICVIDGESGVRSAGATQRAAGLDDDVPGRGQILAIIAAMSERRHQ